MRPISVQLSSMIESDDTTRALQMLLSPWNWKKTDNIQKVEDWFKKTFKIQSAVSFNSGRSALYALLKSLELPNDSEVIIQAFTCVVVPNAILWNKLTPIYADTERDSYNMSIDDLKKKITSKTKVIIVQHTFGEPDAIDEIRKIADEHNIFLIEDCAHSLGNSYHGKLLGTFGDASFFSFGRDKVLSSVFGGMAIVKNEALGKKLKAYQQSLKKPSPLWIIQQLLHPILFSLILPIYTIGIGKLLLLLCIKIGLLSKPVSKTECKNGHPSYYPLYYVNPLAHLAFHQLEKIDHFREKRMEAANLYFKKLNNQCIKLPKSTSESLIRYSIQCNDPEDLVREAKKKGIVLGRWYSNIIDPKGSDRVGSGYIVGSCPHAETMAKGVVNLPTAPVLSTEEIGTVISFVNSYYENNY